MTRSAYGGSCYLNNAAVAAQRLRELGADRVALVDIDAHHGNGAQSIFWERADVFTGSVHVDPATGWFPHFLGTAAERGGGEGLGANLNVPLPPGTGDGDWLARWPRSRRRRATREPRRLCLRSASMRRRSTPRARCR